MEALINELRLREEKADQCERDLHFARNQIREQLEAIHAHFCSEVPIVWVNIACTNKGEKIRLPGYFNTQEDAEREYHGKKRFFLGEGCKQMVHEIEQLESKSIPLEKLARGRSFAPLIKSRHV
jgi:hypothetical protein